MLKKTNNVSSLAWILSYASQRETKERLWKVKKWAWETRKTKGMGWTKFMLALGFIFAELGGEPMLGEWC